MSDERNDWITKRAYELWENAGRPEGEHDQHWNQANSEWDVRQSGSQPAETSPSAWDEEENRM